MTHFLHRHGVTFLYVLAAIATAVEANPLVHAAIYAALALAHMLHHGNDNGKPHVSP